MLEFFIAALVVGIAPGPDNLFVLAQSAAHGARAGFCVILGLCTGIMVQTGLLVAGVSALVAASPTAFFVMQCLGAAYLLYLAYRSFQVRAGNVAIDDENHKPSDVGHPSARKLYLRGIIMNLSNPKVVLFMLSFIPPAVRLDRPIHPSLQTAIFGAEFIVATMIVFGSVALLAGAVKKFLLNSPKANRNLNWFSGCVFVLLAVALFLV
ncbi:Threonine/homoserine/homoserine lactone efflux protein [Fibrobacter sp. UWT2]|uniref:LysE family translocator n=1 Tax=Fibrobacter sp. UWT2 TaxID=1896224 RepID=UPI0009211B00|nr:LysE family translocator [Fibrobacter sp. UWT2]SHK78236.1 Threonine/homoserine/homoserine lactone efflux protein [Fibrobacter sp. UWT2]